MELRVAAGEEYDDDDDAAATTVDDSVSVTVHTVACLMIVKSTSERSIARRVVTGNGLDGRRGSGSGDSGCRECCGHRKGRGR